MPHEHKESIIPWQATWVRQDPRKRTSSIIGVLHLGLGHVLTSAVISVVIAQSVSQEPAYNDLITPLFPFWWLILVPYQ
jgi:hypothetical protein